MADKDYRIYEDVKDMVEDEIEKIKRTEGECLIVGIPDRHGRTS